MIKELTIRCKNIVINRPLMLLLVCWLVVQLFFLFGFGIITTGEAEKYYEETNYFLKTGHFTEAKYIFYSGYIFLHVFFLKLKFETIGLYLVQLLLNFFSMYFLYKLCLKIFPKKIFAFFCVLLVLVCYPWQFWVVHLYTESVFCPLIIIFSYTMFGMESSLKQKIFCVLVFVAILFTRPTGLLFIPLMGILFFIQLFRKRNKVFAGLFALIICSVFFVVLNYAMKSGSSYDFIKPLMENNVICGVPDYVNNIDTRSDNGIESDLMGLTNYILQNPSQFLKAACLKFISFWGMTRSYYSTAHNIALICFFYPIYFLGIVGIMHLRKKAKLFCQYTLGMIAIFLLSVMITCDDWNNRFIMPILPFVILFASYGIYHTLAWFKRKKLTT